MTYMWQVLNASSKWWDNMLLKVETEDLTCLRKHVSLVQNPLFSCKLSIRNWCSQWVAMAPCHCYSWWGWWSDTLWVTLKGYDYTHNHVMFKLFLKLLLWRLLCNSIDNFKFLGMESLIVPHGMYVFPSHTTCQAVSFMRDQGHNCCDDLTCLWLHPLTSNEKLIGITAVFPPNR